MYATHSPRALAVLLLRMDALVADGSASYQHEVVSVEHVMPQQPAPNSQWSTWLPDTALHQKWVHKLGNLTLLSRQKNSSASNYEFERKKNVYFAKGGVCAFAVTTQVLHHATWTVDVMQHRQDAMLSKLESHWRLEDRKSPEDMAGALLAELEQADGLMILWPLVQVQHGLPPLQTAFSARADFLRGGFEQGLRPDRSLLWIPQRADDPPGRITAPGRGEVGAPPRRRLTHIGASSPAGPPVLRIRTAALRTGSARACTTASVASACGAATADAGADDASTSFRTRV